MKLRNLRNLSEYEIIQTHETNETMEPLKPFNSFTFDFSRDEQPINLWHHQFGRHLTFLTTR